MRTKRTMVWCLAASLAVVMAGACDDDDDDGVDGGRGGSGGSDAGGSGGARDGAADGAGGADGARDSGSPDAPGDLALEAAADASSAGLTDPQILGVVLEANQGEVAAGELASARALSADVTTFALRMVQEHSMANTRVVALANQLAVQPADSPIRRELAAEAQSTLATLWATPVSAFDLAYMNSQVQMHTELLALVERLLAVADNPQLRAELMTLRTAVTMHLADARALRDRVASPDAGAPDAAGDAAEAGG